MLIFGRRNDATKKLLANLVNRFLSVHLVQMRGEDIHPFWGKDVMLLKDFFLFFSPTLPCVSLFLCLFLSLSLIRLHVVSSPAPTGPQAGWRSHIFSPAGLFSALGQPGGRLEGGSCPAASSESPRHTASSIAAVCGPEMWLPHP